MNELYFVSNQLKEIDICASTRVYRSDHINIDAVPNWKDNNIIYFRIYNKPYLSDHDIKFSRISMKDSEYIGAENESYILSKDDKKELNKILRMNDRKVWKDIINSINKEHCGEDNWIDISIDLPIPDYNNLK